MRFSALQEEERHVRGLLLGGLPVCGVFVRDGYLDWRDVFSANEGTEVQEPFFAEETDVQIDAVERAERSYGV